MFEFYVILTLAFLYIAFMGGVIGYLIGKYLKKKQCMKIRQAKKIMKARLLMKKNSHWFHVINLPYWKIKHNLMLTHKSIDHRITKAISLTRKKKAHES